MLVCEDNALSTVTTKLGSWSKPSSAAVSLLHDHDISLRSGAGVELLMVISHGALTGIFPPSAGASNDTKASVDVGFSSSSSLTGNTAVDIRVWGKIGSRVDTGFKSGSSLTVNPVTAVEVTAWVVTAFSSVSISIDNEEAEHVVDIVASFGTGVSVDVAVGDDSSWTDDEADTAGADCSRIDRGTNTDAIGWRAVDVLLSTAARAFLLSSAMPTRSNRLFITFILKLAAFASVSAHGTADPGFVSSTCFSLMIFFSDFLVEDVSFFSDLLGEAVSILTLPSPEAAGFGGTAFRKTGKRSDAESHKKKNGGSFVGSTSE
jgi:hypothetical protein